ncbi:MAG: FtsX-like permease family protein [Candidatus Bathyarchaeia archaeon]
MGDFTRALRNVSRRKVRVLLVVIALSFSMAIMTSIPASIAANQTATEQLSTNYQDIIGNMENEISTTLTLIECSSTPSGFSQNITGFPVDFQGGGFANDTGGMPRFVAGEQTYINETAVSDISQIDGVKAVLPIFEKSEGEMQSQETPRGTFEVLMPLYTIVGVPLDYSLLDEYNVLPTTIVEGRTLQEGDSGVVLLSEDNAEYFSAGVGDTITILDTSFQVVGIYESSDRNSQTSLYMEISEAQQITDLKGQISSIDIYAKTEDQVDSIVSEIEVLYPEIQITTYDERLSQLENMQSMYQTTLENSETTLGQTQAIAYQEIGIAIVATSLIVLFTMLYTVRERTHEIGVLKAIGFSNGSIMSQLMFEGILMSLIAGVIGVAIGSIAAPFLSSVLLPVAVNSGRGGGGFAFTSDGGKNFVSNMSFTSNVAATVNPEMLVLSFSLAILLGALGTLYPAWRASRTSPMEALKYE